MQRKWLVAAIGALIGATFLAPGLAPGAMAQDKKLTLLTWNLPIYEEKFRGWIADFKELQDLLGEFQDGEVQAAALRQFAQEMVDAGKVDANAILAMGELSGKFEARQRAARQTLTEHHENYLGRKASEHVDRLVSAARS